MKKLILCLMVILSCNILVYGWGPGAHGALANRIMEDSDITYEISAWGLSKSSISTEASIADVTMPDQYKGWGQFDSLEHFNANWMPRPVTNQMCGFLMHNIEDSSVPTCHCPACNWYCKSCMENQFEAQGEAYSTPAWPSPAYYAFEGNYFDPNTTGFYNDVHNLTLSFKSHNESYFACKYFCTCMTDWIDPNCRRASMKLAWWTFWWFMAYHS
jgi:hypothetical protein